ncbi:MAG: NnrS family protein [Deltaproteobacteria bacterium]|nr:NnrS family protein [Deltaproteobacteria bacterium]
MNETQKLSRWGVFTAAPHRMFFFSAGATALLSMGGWLPHLTGGMLGHGAWPLPPSVGHFLLMAAGPFAMAAHGFLFTALPRWQNAKPIQPRVYVPLWGLQSAGWLVFWGGITGWMPVDSNLAAWVGALMCGSAMGLGAMVLGGKVIWGNSPGRLHGTLVSGALMGGMAAMLLAARGMFEWTTPSGPGNLFGWASAVGLYGFLLPLFFSVTHRMVPFFTGSALGGYDLRRTEWLPWGLVGLSVWRGIMAGVGAAQWYWLADLPLAVMLGRELILWRFWRARGVPLLMVLYLGLGWIVAGLMLSGMDSLYTWVEGGGGVTLDLAARHLLTVGGFSTLWLGMVTRVSRGHGGVGLYGGRFETALFYGFQLVPLMRVIPEGLAALGQDGQGWLAMAGVGWFAAFGAWFGKYGPMFWRPRADGQPG